MMDPDAVEQIWDLMRDPDPGAMDVAQDIAEQHGIKLADLGERWAQEGSRNQLSPKDDEGGWADPGEFKSAGEFVVSTTTLHTSPTYIDAAWSVGFGRNATHQRAGRGARTYSIEIYVSYMGYRWSETDKGPSPLTSPTGTMTSYRATEPFVPADIRSPARARYVAADLAWRIARFLKKQARNGRSVHEVFADLHLHPDSSLGPSIPKTIVNPAHEPPEAALEKYREFHRLEPSRVGEMPELVIPKRLRLAGDAKWVTYRSGKVDPSTLRQPSKPQDYIHEHDAGVRTYLPSPSGNDTDVPTDALECEALVKLGQCLGFCFVDRDGKETEAEGRSPLPEIYCTPNGKVLLVIQGKKDVLAMMWGGALGVFARGIDG